MATADMDLERLSPTGRETYNAIDDALREEVGRRLTAPLDADEIHRITWIAVEALGDQQDRWRREHAERDLVDVLADNLDASWHDCSDDEPCTAPGMSWWRDVAARLVDPHGPLVAIAVERQVLADELGDLAAEVGEDGWLATLEAGLHAVRQCLGEIEHGSGEVTAVDLHRELAQLGAWVAGWVEQLDRQETDRLAALGHGCHVAAIELEPTGDTR